MSKDFYSILGVDKNASSDELKKAFRKQAQKYHPDKPTGDEAKFKEINEAYSVLSNDQKRAQYDQFGSSFNGAQGGAGQGGQAGGFGGFDFSQFTQGQGQDIDINDILGQMFGGGRARRRKGADVQVDVTLTFEECVKGVEKSISFQRNNGSKEDLTISIPAGIDSGEMMRVRGRGEPSPEGENGVSGDLYVRIHVTPHPTLQKEGHHLVTRQKITMTEAILGAKKEIELVDGKTTIKIPKGITHGEILRLKGKGITLDHGAIGDLLVQVKIDIPKSITKKAKKLLQELQSEGL